MMTPHDELILKAQGWKEELWAYMEEFEPSETDCVKALMNKVLDSIDRFEDD